MEKIQQSVPVPLVGISKGKKAHTGGHLLWAVGKSTHNLDILVLISRIEETHSFLLGNLLSQREGLKKPRLYS